MKTLKRSLSLWLAVVLAAGLLYVPAFGSDTKADQQEPVLTTTEEAIQGDGAIKETADNTVIEEETEKAFEDEQEDPAAITEDEDEKDDSASIDDGAAAITEEDGAEASDSIENEEPEAVFSESEDEEKAAEITEGTTVEKSVLPEINDADGLPAANEAEEFYTITFNANGGYYSYLEYDEKTGKDISVHYESQSRDYLEGSVLNNDTENNLYYDEIPRKIFAGWSTSPNGDPFEDDGYVVKESVTLYAVWKDSAVVTLDANGGFIYGYHDYDIDNWVLGWLRSYNRYVMSGYIFKKDDDTDYLEITNDDMHFLGWGTSKDGDLIGDDGLVIDEPTTLYAIWVKPGWNIFESGKKYYVQDSENDTEYYYYADRWALIDGNNYYFDQNGWMVTGWKEIDGELYFLKADGVKAVNEWAKDSGGWCWMDASGKVTKNKWIKDGDEWYYLKSDGCMAANEWASDSGGWYWMDGSGKITRNKWIQSGGQWYYLKANGYMAANEWARDSGGWYWMDGSGKITKNKWIQSGGQWYYLKSNGYMAANEWARDSGGWYWMDASGKITKNKWIQSGGQWYYLKANGYMAANEWAKDSGGWYWMDGSGKITKSKWIQSGGKWYYMGSNGYMVTGWQTIGGNQYWFDSNGVMATGSRTIAGKSYSFNSNGVLQKRSASSSSGSGGAVNVSASYIGNKSSKKFHRSNCTSVGKMSNANKIGFNTRAAAINAGYDPCKICNP